MHRIFVFSILCLLLVSCDKPQVVHSGEKETPKSSHWQVHALSDNNCEILAGLLDKEVKPTESNDQDAIWVEFKMESPQGNTQNKTINCYFKDSVNRKITNLTSDF